MDNGEMRLPGLLDETNPLSEDDLNALRDELLIGVDANIPSWSVADENREVRLSDSLLDPDFDSELDIPLTIEIKEKVTNKLRRFIWSIFN